MTEAALVENESGAGLVRNGAGTLLVDTAAGTTTAEDGVGIETSRDAVARGPRTLDKGSRTDASNAATHTAWRYEAGVLRIRRLATAAIAVIDRDLPCGIDQKGEQVPANRFHGSSSDGSSSIF